VLIAQGRDAADVPITHTFGPNTLVSFKVWTDEVSRPARCPCQNVLRAFVLLCRRLDLYGREWLGVNRTRIKAVNNKDRNFTRTWLQECIRAADERLDDYLRRLDEGDIEEGGTRGRYGAMLAELERTGESQISLTDPDSRAMAAIRRLASATTRSSQSTRSTK
jgi:hypothetical protein